MKQIFPFILILLLVSCLMVPVAAEPAEGYFDFDQFETEFNPTFNQAEIIEGVLPGGGVSGFFVWCTIPEVPPVENSFNDNYLCIVQEPGVILETDWIYEPVYHLLM